MGTPKNEKKDFFGIEEIRCGLWWPGRARLIPIQKESGAISVQMVEAEQQPDVAGTGHFVVLASTVVVVGTRQTE
jgi:hypothetical protein